MLAVAKDRENINRPKYKVLEAGSRRDTLMADTVSMKARCKKLKHETKLTQYNSSILQLGTHHTAKCYL